MTRLSDVTSVHCSLEQTKQGLETFLGSLRARDGVSRLRLRVPMDGKAFGLALEREVRVEASPLPSHVECPEAFAIEWAPEGATIFPRFEGTLTVRHNARPEHSVIALDGAYLPPFGAAGQVFDAAIGRQIAQATAREFLNDLKEEIERRASS